MQGKDEKREITQRIAHTNKVFECHSLGPLTLTLSPEAGREDNSRFPFSLPLPRRERIEVRVQRKPQNIEPGTLNCQTALSRVGTAHPSSIVYAARAYPSTDRACGQVRYGPSWGGHSPCPVPPRPCVRSWCHDSSRHWRSLWLRERPLARPCRCRYARSPRKSPSVPCPN